jgi:hypothetical protein
MSNTVDDVLKELVETLESAIKKGRFTMADMFKMMGKQMQLLEDENGKSAPKTTPVAKRGRPRKTAI